MNKDLNLKSLPATLAASFHKLGRYSVIVFFLFIAVIYGFLLYRINTLTAAEPDSSSLPKNNSPRISEDVVNKVLDLKDNSVSVQALFEDARNNPFQE